MEGAIHLHLADRDVQGLVAVSSDGRRTVASDGERLRLVDGPALGEAAGVLAVGVLEGAIWIVREDAGEHALLRFDDAGAPVGPPVMLGRLGRCVTVAMTRVGLRSALIAGDRGVFVREHDGHLVVEPLGDAGPQRVLIGGRGVAERRGNALMFRRAGTLASMPLPHDVASATVVAAAMVFDGAAVLVELEAGGRSSVLVLDARTGAVRMRARLGDARILAVAERKGIVVLGRGEHVALLDLRAGCCVGECIMPSSIVAGAVDTNATRLLVVGVDGGVIDLAVATLGTAGIPANDAPANDEAPGPEPHAAPAPEPPPAIVASPSAVALDLETELAAAAQLELVALWPATHDVLGGDALDEYLADAFAWISALCRTAQAGAASDVREQEDLAAARFARWNRSGAPYIEVARELGLSTMATTILLLAAAPQIWGELARTYGVLAGDAARPLVDELLLAHLLGAGTRARSEIGRELDPDRPLVSSGAVEIGRGTRPYAAITVHPAIARRLAGAAPAADPGTTSVAPRPLPEIIGPRAAIVRVAQALARPSAKPARVVLRGRTGSGRRSIAAALAAQAGRRLGLAPVDAAASDLEARLCERLREIALRGDVPCVVLDGVPEDPVLRARARQVIDAHPGPLFVRASPSGELPVAPGYLAIELAPLTETERCDAWQRALEQHGLATAPAASLASRFPVGPGAIVQACKAVDGTAPLEAALACLVRQHRSSRIEAIATRIERLPTWNDLIVPDDIADSLRELCARVHHRRTVLEDWGLDAVAITAQGVTALFQGGPGTGKTMAAGVIANTLGYELWRVDLSRVVSKWIGETEKNLAALFEAAEDGEIVLLFDEADSLFGKRTEVKSSNDRNANLETNYLLQRLDTFTGIAILTTNFGVSIDPAFLRRLSVHAQFPFPDEHERERLWRAHIPARLPVAGDLDLAAIARRYPLTGGYIRNAVLRAAYLAASRGSPLSAEDLDRAVRSEYQARGKVSIGGALN